MRRIPMAGLIALVTLLLVPVLSSAQTNIFDDTASTCTGTNCSTLRLPGTLLNFAPSAGNWDINVFSSGGECVRLDVSSQNTDLEMVVVAPNGTVYRNDDRGGGDLRPLVKIDATPNNGWYTVHLARFDGSAVNANFVLLYGRYNTGNVNCSNPTGGFVAPVATKPTIPITNQPKPGEPGYPQ
jgi:hypothetical protein